MTHPVQAARLEVETERRQESEALKNARKGLEALRAGHDEALQQHEMALAKVRQSASCRLQYMIQRSSLLSETNEGLQVCQPGI